MTVKSVYMTRYREQSKRRIMMATCRHSVCWRGRMGRRSITITILGLTILGFTFLSPKLSQTAPLRAAEFSSRWFERQCGVEGR
jgi:hypothetical protein